MGYSSHPSSDSYYGGWRNYPNFGWQSQNQRNFNAPCFNYQEPPPPYSCQEPSPPYSYQEPPPLYPYQEPCSFYSYQEPPSHYSYQESSSPYSELSALELTMKELRDVAQDCIQDMRMSVNNVEEHVEVIAKRLAEEQAHSQGK